MTQTVGLLTASLAAAHTENRLLRGFFPPSSPSPLSSFFLNRSWTFFNLVAFLINTYFLPGPMILYWFPLKCFSFLCPLCWSNFRSATGYATNLPALLNPTERGWSKGLMHSLNIPFARAGALMEAISLPCNFSPLFVFPPPKKKMFFAFDRRGGGGGEHKNKRDLSFSPGLTSVWFYWQLFERV